MVDNKGIGLLWVVDCSATDCGSAECRLANEGKLSALKGSSYKD